MSQIEIPTTICVNKRSNVI